MEANAKEQALARLLNNTAEIITPEELKERLGSGQSLTHYIGFEISGYVHIGSGLMTALVIKDLQTLGVKCTIWLADWHTWINEKLDGKKETAQRIGRGYFTEAMKASLQAGGVNIDEVEFRLASEWYEQEAMKYWETVISVSKHTTTSRMLRSIDILGREQGTEVDHAKTIYPAMQAADIFFQNIDIAHAGMDQRKAHAVMRDTADHIRPGQPKPVAIHHPILMGLQATSADDKMSKSKPDSAIFVHDSEEDIARKIRKAFCPEKETQNNPILNWTKHLLFWDRSESFRIERKAEHGGNVEFNTYEELEAAFADGSLHPMDLKATVAKEITDLLTPVREHFQKPEVAAKKEELDKILATR